MELGLGFAGVADDKRGPQGNVGTDIAPLADPVERFFRSRRARHAFERIGVGVLERHVQIGQHEPLCHERDQVFYEGVGIDIVHPHPCTQLAQIARQRDDGVFGIAPFDVRAVGRSILRDHEQFAHACIDQTFGFAQDGGMGAAAEFAAHVRDDAEFAGVVTALRDLEVAVVARREADASGGQKVHERIGAGRHGGVHGVQHLLVLLGPGHRENLGMRAGDILRLCAQTARDNDAAVGVQCLSDGFKAFGLGTVEKPAGVDDHGLSARIIG